jgi:hypothetical protein
MKELLDKQIALEAKEGRLYKTYQVESANLRNEILLVKQELNKPSEVYLSELNKISPKKHPYFFKPRVFYLNFTMTPIKVSGSVCG